MPAPTAIFTPTPDRAARLLADLNDTSLSFDDLAAKHGTSTEALSLWLSTSAIKDRVYLTLDAMALRIRAVAASRLPQALRAITELIEANPVLQAPALGPSGTGAPDDTLREREFRRRHNESIRRACSLLLRLANFFSPTRPPAPRAPQLAEFPHPAPLCRSPEEVPPHAVRRTAGVRASSPTPTPLLADPPAPASPDIPALQLDRRAPSHAARLGLSFSSTASPAQPHATPHPPQSPACSAESPCSQPGGLKVSSRGQSESASAAPGNWSRFAQHPEGVQVAIGGFTRSDSAARTQDTRSASSSSAIAAPRPPPCAIPGSYQRPRQRFKVRR